MWLGVYIWTWFVFPAGNWTSQAETLWEAQFWWPNMGSYRQHPVHSGTFSLQRGPFLQGPWRSLCVLRACKLLWPSVPPWEGGVQTPHWMGGHASHCGLHSPDQHRLLKLKHVITTTEKVLKNKNFEEASIYGSYLFIYFLTGCQLADNLILNRNALNICNLKNILISQSLIYSSINDCFVSSYCNSWAEMVTKRCFP